MPEIPPTYGTGFLCCLGDVEMGIDGKVLESLPVGAISDPVQ